jgi:hypothetical protein
MIMNAVHAGKSVLHATNMQVSALLAPTQPRYSATRVHALAPTICMTMVKLAKISLPVMMDSTFKIIHAMNAGTAVLHAKDRWIFAPPAQILTNSTAQLVSALQAGPKTQLEMHVKKTRLK